MKYEPAKKLLVGETLETLREVLTAAGHPAFRAAQVLEWVFKHRVGEFGAMANLPKALREWLEERYTLRSSTVELVKKSSDITEKLLLRLGDGALIETVLIRYPQRGVGQDASRKTVCVSTQVGCAYGCRFCASGLDGWKRDLLAGEIVEQLLHVCRIEAAREPALAPAAAPFDNIVVMGMGEPLANYDALLRAIGILNAEWGLRFGARRITVSTCGLAPQIRRLASEPIQFRLAISLHGATDATRSLIMPVNRKYPLAELLPAAAEFTQKHGRMLTLEYILIEEVNDTLEEAQALAQIARSLHAHVNCIPYNQVEGLNWKRPSLTRQRAFGRVLEEAGISFTIRKEKGHDIDAACGQLRLRTERQQAAL